MNIRELAIRRIKKTLQKREFWFVIVVYPLMLCAYFFLKNNDQLRGMVEKSRIWYFVVSFLVSVYVVFLVVFEIIEKKWLHKTQGAKLNIKRKENDWR